KLQLAACKANQLFAFSSTPAVVDGVQGNQAAYVIVLAEDQTLAPVPLVEKITFPFTIQTPQPLITLVYDDSFPYSIGDAVPMPFCNFDPRTPGSEFGLRDTYKSDANKGLVIPGGATSCLILQSQAVGTADSPVQYGTYTAYVYSDIDSLRGATP